MRSLSFDLTLFSLSTNLCFCRSKTDIQSIHCWSTETMSKRLIRDNPNSGIEIYIFGIHCLNRCVNELIWSPELRARRLCSSSPVCARDYCTIRLNSNLHSLHERLIFRISFQFSHRFLEECIVCIEFAETVVTGITIIATKDIVAQPLMNDLNAQHQCIARGSHQSTTLAVFA